MLSCLHTKHRAAHCRVVGRHVAWAERETDHVETRAESGEGFNQLCGEHLHSMLHTHMMGDTHGESVLRSSYKVFVEFIPRCPFEPLPNQSLTCQILLFKPVDGGFRSRVLCVCGGGGSSKQGCP